MTGVMPLPAVTKRSLRCAASNGRTNSPSAGPSRTIRSADARVAHEVRGDGTAIDMARTVMLRQPSGRAGSE